MVSEMQYYTLSILEIVSSVFQFGYSWHHSFREAVLITLCISFKITHEWLASVSLKILLGICVRCWCSHAPTYCNKLFQ